MSILKSWAMPGVSLVVALIFANTATSQTATTSPVRRLMPAQYEYAIQDLFGRSIELGGRFEPAMRVEGLIELGSGRVSMSSAGMAQFDAMARNIAAQVLSEKNREIMVPCKPHSTEEPDDACASQFLARTGKALFRRPLDKPELEAFVNAANRGAMTTRDFYVGLSLALAAELSAPQFLYRYPTIEREPRNRGRYRLDGYAKATQLSFFLWNSAPDAILLAAAENGDLHSKQGLNRQVERMLASPRLERGIRAFFADMLQFDDYATLTKDSTLYPKFDSIVLRDAQEQTLRTIANALLTDRDDYRELFTTRKTFLTQRLASVYQLPLVNHVPNGAGDQWQEYEFPQDDNRAGLLTHISFTAFHSHPGRSSPTLRGKALREVFLCQAVPAPPANVDFQVVQDTGNPIHRTVRSRLAAHATNPVCAGCHKLTDPIGLSLENFDGSGAYRTQENGEQIDVVGQLDSAKFSGPKDLGRAMGTHPQVPACLVNRMTAYGIGRPISPLEKGWVDQLKASFAGSGYVVPALMQTIVTSPEFFQARVPEAQEITARAD